MSNIDLWPEDLIIPLYLSPAQLILEEQSGNLEEKTKGFLKGFIELSEVCKRKTKVELVSEFACSISFSIFAPLTMEKVELFRVKHGLHRFYPLEVYVCARLFENYNSKQYTANGEEEFKEILKAILSLDNTRAIVTTLTYRASEYKRNVQPAKLMTIH